MIDAGIDIIRLGADFARFIPPAAPYAQGVGSLVEFVGFIKSGVELIKGDPRSMLVSQTTNSAKAIVMVARLERTIPIPVIGAIGNLVSLGINLQPQITEKWVTE